MRIPKRGVAAGSRSAATPGSVSVERSHSSQRTSDRIAIIGLGYVGLPLALQFARSGTEVIGLDIDKRKTDTLQKGRSYIQHVPATSILEQLRAKRFCATTDFSTIRQVSAVIICVPTPLNKNREPDISYILETGKAIAPYLQQGTLVVLESTTYPGTTEEDLLKVLEENAGLKAGVDFHLAFSPEREDPGNPGSKVASIPKVVGALTSECLKRATDLYGKAITTIIPLSSCRAAEATKLLENIFRSVNIALVNELKVVYDAMGIDIWEVINAAKTKPFGYMPFYPGPGFGGHCIPIDPFYLTWKAREYGQHTRFIELAGEINGAMPQYVVDRTAAALNEGEKPLKGSRVLIIGLAYKSNVDDERESPSYRLMELLEGSGAVVRYYDPHVPVVPPTREHQRWLGIASVKWNRKTIAAFDAVIISTAHDAVNYEQLSKWCPCIIDTRNAMAKVKTRSGQIYKA